MQRIEQKNHHHFEHQKAPLAPYTLFIRRLVRSFIIAMLIIVTSIAIGMCGYHYIEGIAWIDAFLEASMILSGMGPIAPLHSTAGKIFAGMFAIYAGYALLVTIAIVLAPIIHRFLHKFHLEK